MKRISLLFMGLFLLGLIPSLKAEEPVKPAESAKIETAVPLPEKTETAKPTETAKSAATEKTKTTVAVKKTSKKMKHAAKKEMWTCKHCKTNADHAGKCDQCGMDMEKI